MDGFLNMAKSSIPRGLKPPSVRAPKAEIQRVAPAPAPLRTSAGRDVISVVTRMRETPSKKGR